MIGGRTRCRVFQNDVLRENIDRVLSKTSKMIEIGAIATENDGFEVSSVFGVKLQFYPPPDPKLSVWVL